MHSFLHSQKPDADLTFEDSFGSSLSDDKISNQLNENSRTKLVSKRSVSDDSDKQQIDDNQIESDEGWLSSVKRRLSNFFTGREDKVQKKRALIVKPIEANKSQQKPEDLTTDFKLPLRKRRHDDDDDDEDDDDNDIGSSGDHETTPDPDPITPLPPVKDDKYCKIFAFLSLKVLP